MVQREYRFSRNNPREKEEMQEGLALFVANVFIAFVFSWNQRIAFLYFFGPSICPHTPIEKLRLRVVSLGLTIVRALQRFSRFTERIGGANQVAVSYQRTQISSSTSRAIRTEGIKC